MTIIKNCVLLLKAENLETNEEDKFEVTLVQQGFAVKHLKTLEFTFQSLDQLKEKLCTPDYYSGIIFTTPRSVKATNLAYGNISGTWKDKLNYVVGETTCSAALNELGIECKGQESGNANNLADMIIRDCNTISKPFLFPCGNRKTDTLITKLAKAKIEVDIITVYETIGSSTLDQDFFNLTCDIKKIPEYFVYFSPSGVHNTFKYLEKIKDSVKFIAIGPTTENALSSYNLKVNAVASKPTPNDILQAILNC